MNIQELRQKCKDNFSPYKDQYWIKTFDKIFDEFETSNQEQPEITEITEVTKLQSMNLHFDKKLNTLHLNLLGVSQEIKTQLYAEIEGMKKEIFEQYAYTKKYIACIDECRAEIDNLKQRLMPMVGVCVPKQDVYTHKKNEVGQASEIFKNGKHFDYFYTRNAAEICDKLNELDKSK